jgi:hypothetical protein
MNLPATIEHLPVAHQAQSIAEIRGHVQLVQQVLKGVMKEKTHYDVIPGTDKPTLLKPGAELLCMAFRIAPQYRTEDLSGHDEVRYRVVCEGVHQQSGITLGSGMGECSSSEEKYKWRRVVCDEEFEEAPEDRKRIKFQRGKGGSVYKNKQVRTEPADVANTVLKMAAKRAQVAMTLNVTAASDMFSQDLDEMTPELRDSLTESEGRQESVKEPKAKPKSEPSGPPGAINATQAKLLRSQLERRAVPESVLLESFKLEKLEDLPAASFNEASDVIKAQPDGSAE